MNNDDIRDAIGDTAPGHARELLDGGARLREDLRTLARDAEALLRSVGGASREGLGAARGRLEATLAEVRGRLAGGQGAARTQVDRAMVATGDYVSANPVKAVAIAAAVGALLAWFLTRGGEEADAAIDAALADLDAYGDDLDGRG
jgi:ElaB/YqjD/DUF883 family membrane-anchored ribosome-binding protein